MANEAMGRRVRGKFASENRLGGRETRDEARWGQAEPLRVVVPKRVEFEVLRTFGLGQFGHWKFLRFLRLPWLVLMGLRRHHRCLRLGRRHGAPGH